MNINVSLTPHLVQFVREQLASGRFASEEGIIRAALCLLEEQIHSQRPLPAKPELQQSAGSTSGTSLPAPQEHRDGLREGLPNDAKAPSSSRRSPRGILADLRSHINPEDIKKARSELWAGIPHDDA